ncbi:STAS domain-containing protein [Mycobacterium sp. Aquia_213]|uniref:STAS domain-containing protein n=1 Tax=Mycobacterium sp. Aquia_213 TaxID=2991728 RepID=UPI0022717BE4|nr:STAS domain-containing protein [Mycobacterium sp. Aquia_213]WAC90270.1 STAS domain-containing protein [Mycobacterium sp. Aquia_213]
MIAPLARHADNCGFTPDSSIVHCNGALMRAHCRDQATIVKITGEIDATNIDRFSDYIRRFTEGATGLIVDLSGVEFLCARGISVLVRLNNDCHITGTRWAIVASPAVRRLLHIGVLGDVLPTVNSERQALKAVANQGITALAAS